MSAAGAVSPLRRPNDRLRRRRAVNRGMELLAWLAAALGRRVLAVLVSSVAQQGIERAQPRPLHEGAGRLRRPAGAQGLECVRRHHRDRRHRDADGAARRDPRRDLRERVRVAADPDGRRALGLDVLNGVPAIVIGDLRLRPDRASVTARAHSPASVALAIIMLPLVARTTIEVLALVPDSLREAALALGVAALADDARDRRCRSRSAASSPARSLAVARVAGETAPLLFTSSIVAQRRQLEPGACRCRASRWRSSSCSESAVPGGPRAGLGGRARADPVHPARRASGARWLATRSRRKISGPRADDRGRTMSVSSTHRARRARRDEASAAAAARAARDRSSTSRTSTPIYGSKPALKDVIAGDLQERRHGDHRPVGLRQEHVPPLPEPDERPRARASARRARSATTARTSTAAASTRSRCGADRHGLPAAEPVPEVDLRQRRLGPADARA